MSYRDDFATGVRREELSPEAEAELWAGFVATRDDALKDRLIDHYFPLVYQTAERMAKHLPDYLDVEDLISYGSLGLLDAIDRFSPDREVRFSTFCQQRIRGAILDELRRLDWVPRAVRIQETQHRRMREELESTLGRRPNDEEMALALDLTEEEYAEFQRELRVKTMVSLERKRDEDDDHDQGQIDLYPDRSAVDPLTELARKEVKERALRGLSPDEKVVLALYYEDGLKFKEIGQIIGKSESRVCQIHSRMIEFLRQKFSEAAVELGEARP